MGINRFFEPVWRGGARTDASASSVSIQVHSSDASWQGVQSVVGLSATISPPDFYLDLLGFDRERTSTLSLPSPFPAENRRVVIDPAVATTWKRRPENYRPIAERMAEFADALVPGNCLALFPSYEFLSRVAAHLVPRTKRLFLQERAHGDSERQAMLAGSSGEPFWGTFCCSAVAGGVFAEGVDYPGDTLRAVAVVGPCLPGISLEQDLLRSYYDELFERGFEYASVVPGMTRVVQAAGRLIRSPQDIGIIVLMGERFLIAPYRRHLPTDWIPEQGLQELTGNRLGSRGGSSPVPEIPGARSVRGESTFSCTSSSDSMRSRARFAARHFPSGLGTTRFPLWKRGPRGIFWPLAAI